MFLDKLVIMASERSRTGPSSRRAQPYQERTSTWTTAKAPWFAGRRGTTSEATPPPGRPVFAIVDYMCLRDFAVDFEELTPSNFENATPQELEAIFTFTQQYSAEVAHQMPVGNIRFGVCHNLWRQFNLRVATSDVELRYQDLDGDTFQVSNDTTIVELLDTYRPEWRIRQSDFLSSAAFVGATQPFLLRLSCHKYRPGIILP